MQCVNHSDRPASALCQRCDKTLCDECIEERNGRRFCADCAVFVDQRVVRRPARAAAVAAPGAAAPNAPADVYQGPAPADVYHGPAPGDVYQGPVPAEVYQGPAPTDVYQGPAPGDVNQGPAPADDYQGPAPADVYQGPAPGDLYEGPAPGALYEGPPSGGVYQGAIPGAAVAAAVPEEADFSIRGLLAGFIGVIISAALYYWLFVGLDLRFTWFVLIMAFLVAATARLGAGRAGRDVGLVAAGLFVLSVVLGQYLVAKKFHEQVFETSLMQRQAVAEIRIDGRYTDDEARRLLGYLTEEWEELSPDEKQWHREMLRAEYEEAKAEGYDPRELYDVSYEVAGEAMEATLSLGAYFGDLMSYLGIWGIFFLALGCWEAYKIASTEM